MATMQITVWEGAAAVALGLPIQEEVVDIGGSNLESNVIDGTNEYRTVRVFCDTDAWVNWGENAVAAADGESGRMMGANNPEYFHIRAGHVVSVIQRT